MRVVAYYRVSTQKQRQSGLGLEAQQADVASFVASNGAELLASYTETETGKKHSLDNRPELQKAIAHATRSQAVLVVAKIDRLYRSTVVRAMLKTTGLHFIACDQPQATELTLDILAAVAEDEVRKISQRTKDALAAYKARGGILGATRKECRNLSREARLVGCTIAAQRAQAKAADAYTDLLPGVRAMKDGGLSYEAIAKALTAAGHTTRKGKPWNPTQVWRVLSRAA